MLVFLQYIFMYQISNIFKIMMWKFGKNLNFCLSSSLYIFRYSAHISFARLSLSLAPNINSVHVVFVLVPAVVDICFVSCGGDACF